VLPFSKAERAACDRALVIDPRDPFALEARSRLKAEAGDVDGAIEDLDLAIESFPRSSRLRSVRGYYGELKGDYDQALVDFSEAIQLDPHVAYPLSRRATIHLRRQDLDKAFHDADDALGPAEEKGPAASVRSSRQKTGH
jgi:tetratricopeptide (TPR) repeat protein